MNNFAKSTILVLVLTISGIAQARIWNPVSDSLASREKLTEIGNPAAFTAYRFDENAAETLFRAAPQESMTIGIDSSVIFQLPNAEGKLERFRIKNSPIMEPELAAKYPMINSYSGQGIDDPTATVRMDLSPLGFRAMILSKHTTVYVEPADKGIVVAFAKDSVAGSSAMACLTSKERSKFADLFETQMTRFSSGLVESGTVLRTYRLALAATGEYTAVFAGSATTDAEKKANALAAMNTTMNRVNGIYERDLAVRMVLVANEDQIIYVDPNTDPYTNSNGSAMLSQNQTNLNNVIGTANYDIGHVFSTGGGGIAGLGVLCGSFKAEGVTGLTNPTGDVFSVDYVAHEMGHQFDGDHTFNGTASNCGGGNRSGVAAYEPGSGSTIQAYAGICGSQNLQRNSDDYFHIKSLEQMLAHIEGSGACYVGTSTGNTPPQVTPAPGTVTYQVPKQTPFELTAAATDADNDEITYNWEEYDLGAASSASTPDSDADGNARPIFRSHRPLVSPKRTFPSMQYVLDNGNIPPATIPCGGSSCIPGEIMPSISRNMAFAITARDNRAGGGGIKSSLVNVVVSSGAGPFKLLSQNSAANLAPNAGISVTWDVANTQNAPISAANVKITLSNDGGQTFPFVLAESTPNDGSEIVVLPQIETTTARIKIQAVGNVFFDINDVNFTIANTAPRVKFDYDGDSKADIAIFRPSQGEWWRLRSTDGGNNAYNFGSATDISVPGDYTGDGKYDFAFFRPSTGEWFVLRSEDSSFFAFPFGIAGDIPAPGDFDGDGKTDAAIYRPSLGIWFILRSSNGLVDIVSFGSEGDVPLVADYDNDGKDDTAIYRAADHQYWLNRSTSGVVVFQFGTAGDKPFAADFTGDGTADPGFWRPSTGEWFVIRSENQTFFAFPFGANGDIPAPADYDGDGTADATVFRPSTNTWFSNQSTSGVVITPFGAAGDVPVAGIQ